MKPVTALKIADEDGFIALINAHQYASFVSEDWTLSQLMNHFVTEMNKHTIIVWGTNPGGGDWNIVFLSAPSDKKAFQEFTMPITVTDGKLYLTEYTALTMAAQFADNVIPDKYGADLFVEMENGIYQCHVRQLFDLDDFDYLSEDHTYEIIIQPDKEASKQVENVFWNHVE